ncbi:hypothetical protein AgCh_015862 [Apium graveolens]
MGETSTRPSECSIYIQSGATQVTGPLVGLVFANFDAFGPGDGVGECKMLGPAMVQRNKDIIDLIRGWLGVAQDGHKKYADLTASIKIKQRLVTTPMLALPDGK